MIQANSLIHIYVCVCAGLYQFLPPDSREFEDLVKIISSFYLDPSSRGCFSYCKARLIHNELLEKEVGLIKKKLNHVSLK